MSPAKFWRRIAPFTVSAIFIVSSYSAHSETVRYLVKTKGSASTFERRALVRSAETRLVASELNSNGGQARAFQNLGLVAVSGEREQMETMLREHPLVEYYEKEISWQVASGEGQPLPSSQAAAPWMEDLMGLDANSPDPDVGYSGPSPVVVAVIDTGTQLDHPYLRAGLNVNAAEANGSPGVDDDGNGYVDDVYGANVFSQDGNTNESGSDHGTHVAGLVKSVRDQALVHYSEAAAVRILPIKFIDNSGAGSTSGAIAALEYAASRGARVINASWGARGQESFSRALYDTMLDLYAHEVFISVAAGNAERGVANDNDQVPYFPANFNIPGLMSIASVTPIYGGSGLRDIFMSSFSNYGATSVDIAAVGDYLDAQGASGVWSSNARYSSPANEFVRKKGTSMATPIVSGIAGVVRAINPSLTAYEVRELIRGTSVYSPRLNKLKTSAYVSARAAFDAARTAVSHGAHPGVESPIMGASAGAAASPAPTSRRGGGCGTLKDVSGGEGPGGGNSVMLFAGLYFASQLVRRRRSLFR